MSRESGSEGSDEPAHPGCRRAPIRRRDDNHAERDGAEHEPAERGGQAPARERPLGRSPRLLHPFDGHEANPCKVHEHPEPEDHPKVELAAGTRHDKPGDHQQKRAAGDAVHGIRNLGVEHGRPQQDEGADHGESDPAEQVEREVRRVQAVVPSGWQLSVRHGNADAHPDRERDARRDVVLHERSEPSRQSAARLQHKHHHVRENDDTHEDAAREHERPERGHHSGDDNGDAERVPE